jgi:hypothetical protein
MVKRGHIQRNISRVAEDVVEDAEWSLLLRVQTVMVGQAEPVIGIRPDESMEN